MDTDNSVNIDVKEDLCEQPLFKGGQCKREAMNIIDLHWGRRRICDYHTSLMTKQLEKTGRTLPAIVSIPEKIEKIKRIKRDKRAKRSRVKKQKANSDRFNR